MTGNYENKRKKDVNGEREGGIVFLKHEKNGKSQKREKSHQNRRRRRIKRKERKDLDKERTAT